MTETNTLDFALDVIRRRRSVRVYKPEKLSWSTINMLLAAAVRAPTAAHQESWAFVVVQDIDVLRRLSDRARLRFADEPHRELLARGGHAVDIFAKPGFNIFYDASTLIVIGTQMEGPLVAADCWLAAENLMLAAAASGLGTCVIGSALAALNLPEVKAELRIPADFTAVAPIIAGVPGGDTPLAARNDPRVLAWA